MKTSIFLIIALVATTLMPSCSGGGSGGGSGGVNANVGGLAKVSAGGSGHSRRR